MRLLGPQGLRHDVAVVTVEQEVGAARERASGAECLRTDAAQQRRRTRMVSGDGVDDGTAEEEVLDVRLKSGPSRARPATRRSFSKLDYSQAFSVRGLDEPAVEGHERQRVRSAVRGDGGRRELESVARAQVMHPEHAPGSVSDRIARFHFRPGVL